MIPIKVPPLGESIVEATVARWLKQEGDSVTQGETLVELETDKITVEVSAFKSGRLARVTKQEGETVAVDETLGELDETAAVAAATAAAPAATAATAATPAAAPPPRAPSGEPPRPAPAAAPRTSPAARRIAEEEQIDLSTVPGSGRGGRVTKADVVARPAQREAPAPRPPGDGPRAPAAPAPTAPPRPPSGAAAGSERETSEKMSTRRRRIAEHLLEAQHATAHLTTFNEVDMSAVVALRDRLKERVEKEHGVRLTFMPFFVKASCMALKTYPVVNAQIDGDSIIYKHYVNMGIAVASDQGLIVPVVKDADTKSMIEVSRDIADVAARARDGKVTMDDLTGGTFTITNGGVFGSLVSTPILNYPQVGILGLHKIQDRPVAVDGKIEIRPMMYVALSYDHRIVDGQQAVLFLVRIKQLMEDPAAMLVE
jgi:2-oxoglutarate dehydrogenase E2 component (dihydrolipoamide succinyltransferase)